MAGSTKAQQKAAIDRQMAHLKTRKDVIDAAAVLEQKKAAAKAARARRAGSA